MEDPFKISGFIMLAFILGASIISITLISKMVTNIRDTSTPNNSALQPNDTLTWGGNNTAMALTQTTLGIQTPTVYNNGSLVAQGDGIGGNWTYSASDGTIKVINASPSGKVGFQSEWITGTINVSYNYNIGSSSRNITDNLNQVNLQMTKQLPLVGFAVILGVIITSLLGIYLYNKFRS